MHRWGCAHGDSRGYRRAVREHAPRSARSYPKAFPRGGDFCICRNFTACHLVEASLHLATLRIGEAVHVLCSDELQHCGCVCVPLLGELPYFLDRIVKHFRHGSDYSKPPSTNNVPCKKRREADAIVSHAVNRKSSCDPSRNASRTCAARSCSSRERERRSFTTCSSSQLIGEVYHPQVWNDFSHFASWQN